MNKKSALRLFFGAYALTVMGLLLFSLASFASDCIYRATGAITTREYTADSLLLKDFDKLALDKIVTTSEDPQLIIEDYNSRATVLRMDMSFNKYPGEVCLYYTRAEEEFSLNQRLWGKQRNDGSYEFVLPRGKISRIRVDPSNFVGVEIALNSFTLNPRRGFMSYFIYSGETMFNVCVWPGIIAALIAWLYTSYFLNSKIAHMAAQVVSKAAAVNAQRRLKAKSIKKEGKSNG